MSSPLSASAMSFAERSTRLDEDGFVIWPRLVPEALAAAHVAAHESWLEERGRHSPAEWAALSRAEQVGLFVKDYVWHESSPTALELFYRPALIEFLTGHFGAEPVMRAPQTGERHRGASIHADSFGTPVDPPGAEIRVWVALEDIDPASGPLYLIPGSHSITQAVRDRILRECPEPLEQACTAQARHKPTHEVPAAFYDLGRHIERCWTAEVAERRLPRRSPDPACRRRGPLPHRCGARDDAVRRRGVDTSARPCLLHGGDCRMVPL
jgi:hypothetical protein